MHFFIHKDTGISYACQPVLVYSGYTGIAGALPRSLDLQENLHLSTLRSKMVLLFLHGRTDRQTNTPRSGLEIHTSIRALLV